MLTLKMKALKFAYDHFRSVVIKDILHLSKKVCRIKLNIFTGFNLRVLL